MVRDTLLGAIATKLVQPSDEIVSVYHRRLEHGYPTPRCFQACLGWARRFSAAPPLL